MLEICNELLEQLLVWMKQQVDFIELGQPLPLLKPNQHPLDKTTRLKKVPTIHLGRKLKIRLHAC